MIHLSKFARYAWAVLVYNVCVIVFGAFVRATGSGAGCGSHWPTCNGVLVPRGPALETIIEFTHRISSGITLVLIVGLLVWAWRSYPKGSWLRVTSGAVFFFIILESLLGAGLVLFNLVQENATVVRAFSMMLHLMNTFMLLASLTLTAWFASFGEPVGFEKDRKIRWLLLFGALGLLFLGATGSIAALGDTLFPSTSLAEGFRQDFSNASNYLLRLRVFHPLIAIITGSYAAGLGIWLRNRKSLVSLNRVTGALAGLVVLQLGFGALNVVLLAPVWIQLIHLFLTCSIWICYVLTSVLSLVTSYFSRGIVEHHIDDRVHQATAQ